MGYRVGLDDFGAGAASMNYLHTFQVDFVKFDGAMIRKIGASGATMHCWRAWRNSAARWEPLRSRNGLKPRQMAEAARAMGFQQGQGKWLGAPLATRHDCRPPHGPEAVGGNGRE